MARIWPPRATLGWVQEWFSEVLRGLRPSKALAFQDSDMSMPEQVSFTNSAFAIFGLEVRNITKAE